MTKLITTVSLLAILTLLGWRAYPRLLEAGAQVNQGPLFHDVAAGSTANFAVHGATEVHLISHFVLPRTPTQKSSYALQVAFVAADGTVRKESPANLSIAPTATPSTLPDGSTVAQERLLSFVLPPDTAFLQIGCADGRVLLRANRIAATKASREAVLERSGMPATWFAKEELEGLRSHGFVPLPVLGDLPTVKLTPALLKKVDAAGKDAESLDGLLRLAAHRAMVVNVIGPGSLKIALAGRLGSDDQPQFQVEHIGPGSTGRAAVKGGLAALELPAGPSSVIVRSLDNQETLLQLESKKLRALGRTDDRMEPAARIGSAWRLTADKVIRFPMYGQKDRPTPVRVTAHALDLAADKDLRWRFLDESGESLLSGALQLSTDVDPFSGVLVDEEPTDIGLASRTFLVPPPGTSVLELAAPNALVEVDALLEKGAVAQMLPPFDMALGPELHWQDAPVLGARWVMLRPLETQSEKRLLYAKVLRTPRIEPIAPLPQGPWMPVMPHGTVKKLPILEAVQDPTPDKEPQALIRTHHTTSIVVGDEGKNARRVVLTCDIPGKLGGELTLRRNGQILASAPILTSAVRLTANAPAGTSRIRVEGPTKGHCTIAARLLAHPLTVKRSIFLASHRGLKVHVRTKGTAPVRLHYAIYTTPERANKEAAVAVTVDGGAPKRRAGSATAATLGQAYQVLPLAPVSLQSPELPTGSTLRRVAVAAVQLGDDLPRGHHRVKVRVMSPGRYWARFWVQGKKPVAEAAESFVSADPADQVEVEQ
ncbi:MAG TPA: hypothetical protein PLW65_08725 [Pseudomonadota bacterium]|nr:hypothetical protein [Pseudomonadota bacterium]